MVDFILGALFSFPFWIAAYVLAAILLDFGHIKTSALFAVAFGFVAHHLFRDQLPADWRGWAYIVIAYLLIGTVWSTFKWFRHCDRVTFKLSEDIKGMPSPAREDYKRGAQKRIQPSNNLDKLTSWIALWPFSISGTLLADAYRIIDTIVTRYFKGVYAIITKHFSNKIDQL